MFLGKAGVGKSTTINSVCAAIVAKVGSSAKAVTKVPSVVFRGSLCGKEMQFVDVPGFNDPDISNMETLQSITSLLNEKISGLDAIFHVMRMGRIDANAMEIPRLILSGLACSAPERARLAKRYFIIVTGVNAGDDVSDGDDEASVLANSMSEFRGKMLQSFPPDLEEAVRSAIFVENSTKVPSWVPVGPWPIRHKGRHPKCCRGSGGEESRVEGHLLQAEANRRHRGGYPPCVRAQPGN